MGGEASDLDATRPAPDDIDAELHRTTCDPRRCTLRDHASGMPELYGSGGHLYSWADHRWHEITWKGRSPARMVLPCMRGRGPEALFRSGPSSNLAPRVAK